jgi:ArsR family transcriptional regulator
MSVTLDQLRSRMRDHRVVILDVLSPEAYAHGHIPGAINIPVRDIRQRAPVELPDRNREIIAYCGGPT